MLLINKDDLVKALLDTSHVGSIPDQYPWMIAINHGDDQPQGRVIWCDTPSSKAGYFANFVGEENYSPGDFVDDYADLSWGEGDDDDPEDADLVRMAAADWIEENLKPVVDLGDYAYQVEYI